MTKSVGSKCSCGGTTRLERWDNVVWDECNKCGAKWDERSESTMDDLLIRQTELRENAIQRVKQLMEVMRDIVVITQGDKEAVADAKASLRAVLRCIEDINGNDE